MNTSVISATEALAYEVQFEKEKMHVYLLDGRVITLPLEWFPKLRRASAQQKNNWRLIGKGVGIHWKGLDEDISVSALLRS